MPLFAPLNYSAVEDGIHRSATPTTINFQFLSALSLKTLVLLGAGGSDVLDEDPRLAAFVAEQGLRVVLVGDRDKGGQGPIAPITEERVVEALQVLTNNANFPVLVTSHDGKSLVGLVVACLRKLQRWSLVSIYEEYRRFSVNRSQQQHEEQFIELFDTEIVILSPDKTPSFLLA